MIQRGGQVVIRILEDVRQTTIQPLSEATIRPVTLVPTDKYTTYKRLPEWDVEHQTVYHNAGEYARDEDGDGFHKIHVNTMEGLWSLQRSWLRPHRGISQEHFPLYRGFFEFVHNAKNRGKGLMDSLLGLLLRYSLESIKSHLLSVTICRNYIDLRYIEDSVDGIAAL